MLSVYKTKSQPYIEELILFFVCLFACFYMPSPSKKSRECEVLTLSVFLEKTKTETLKNVAFWNRAEMF